MKRKSKKQKNIQTNTYILHYTTEAKFLEMIFMQMYNSNKPNIYMYILFGAMRFWASFSCEFFPFFRHPFNLNTWCGMEGQCAYWNFSLFPLILTKHFGIQRSYFYFRVSKLIRLALVRSFHVPFLLGKAYTMSVCVCAPVNMYTIFFPQECV